MKSTIIIILIGTMSMFKFSYSENLADEFFKYEKLKNTVVLTLNKVSRFHKSKGVYKIKNEVFFRIVPPEYEVTFDTVEIFDEKMFIPEMKVLYQIVQEQILIKKGGYKWINEKVKVVHCNHEHPFKFLEKNKVLLKFVKEPDEYGLISRLVLHPSHSPNRDGKIMQEQNRKATEIAKEGRMKMILRSEKIITNGYLKQCSLSELEKEYVANLNLIKLRKGCWEITKKEKSKINCEPSIVNIQLALRALGYETNVDGRETPIFKFAKKLFIQENDLDYRDKNEFLKALRF